MIDLDDYIVKPNSTRRLYHMVCDQCGCDRGYQRKIRHGHGMCKSCIARTLHKNKIVSEETRKKMSAASWAKNGGTHPLQGKNHTIETKVKLSKAACRQNKSYKAVHQYLGIKGLIFMKSSWEVKYAQWLDSNGLEWQYEPEFELSNGYSYLPDFQLSSGVIIEIKGYMRQDAQEKWDLFCSDYPNVDKQLLRKEDLKKLGII